ncbi:MAG: hypothetical protein WEA80_13120 [Gemmatimonadaceae bacterium]
MKSQLEKVRAWLAKEGYPLELEIGRQLRDAGVNDIEHGHLYRDQRSGKWREVDILGTQFTLTGKPGEPTQPPSFTLRFVVECKYSHRPWLVLASESSQVERQFPSGYLLGAVGSAIVRRAEMPNVGRYTTSGSGVTLKAFGLGAMRGHGVVQALGAKKAGPNMAYRAVRSVVAAAGAEAARTDASLLAQVALPGEPRVKQVFLHLPVVVVQGSIFELSLNREGRESLREVEEAGLLAPGPHGKASPTLVRIVRPGVALKTLVGNAITDAQLLTEVLRPEWADHVRLAHLPQDDSPAALHLAALRARRE